MRHIGIYVWWRCGKLDGDSYDTEFEVSDEEYNTIVELVKTYIKENCEDDDIYVDPQDFTNNYFYDNARSLYEKIDKETTEILISDTIATSESWFSEEDEGCTIEEYINNNYEFGFYLSDVCIDNIVDSL